MMENRKTINQKELEYRRKRVERIKKMIIGTIIALIVIPTICCVFLLLKIKNLEEQLEKLMEVQSKKIEESFVDFDTALSSTFIYSTDVNSINVIGSSLIIEEKNAKGLTYEEQLDKTIEKKKVYLTFDDGPGKYTAKLLDTLAEYNVKATFFVNGREDEESLKLYKRMVDEGHTLAMHSYTHDYDKIYSSVKAFEKDFNKLSNLLYKTTGVRPKYFRFPGGSSNKVSSLPMTDFITYLNDKNIVYFDWNVINGDATGKKLTKGQMIKNVMSGVRGNTNSIVLMHDIAAGGATVESVSTLIKKLQKEDYVILPITKYTTPIQHIKADSVK